MELIITLLFIVGIFVVLFLIEYWWVLLIFVGIGVVVAIPLLLAEYSKLQNVVKAKIVSEEPIVEQICENTGHTTSYGRHLSYHEHYRNRNVITGYNVKFVVEYKNGKRGTITCKKDSATYDRLIICCNLL